MSSIWLYYRNEDDVDDRGSDLGHDDLLILGRNAASAVSYQAEHSIPPSDRQIMSEVWASITLYNIWQQFVVTN